MKRSAARRTAIVGAGICGLAHAMVAARQGDHVTVFERSAVSSGASVRNFGTIWPIGQAPGRMLDRALHSRTVWMELAHAAGFWLRPCGSLHLAYQADELAVLEEFAVDSRARGYRCQMIGPARVLELAPCVRDQGLLGGLWSETELAIDPREAIQRITRWLSAFMGVRFEFASPVREVGEAELVTAVGERHAFDRCVVCCGDDLESLFPRLLSERDLTRCKLQMLRTGPQPSGWRLGPHLAGGLTLRHYPSFAHCPGLDALKARIAAENGCYDAWGIHVLVAQNGLGELIIGDSHHYGSAFDFGQQAEIDELILDYLGRMLDIPRPAIQQRWSGTYAKRTSSDDVLVLRPTPEVSLVTGLGGAGMTIAFGLAEEVLGTEVAARIPSLST